VHFGPRPTLEVNLDGTITQRQQPTQNLSREERAVCVLHVETKPPPYSSLIPIGLTGIGRYKLGFGSPSTIY